MIPRSTTAGDSGQPVLPTNEGADMLVVFGLFSSAQTIATNGVDGWANADSQTDPSTTLRLAVTHKVSAGGEVGPVFADPPAFGYMAFSIPGATAFGTPVFQHTVAEFPPFGAVTPGGVGLLIDVIGVPTDEGADVVLPPAGETPLPAVRTAGARLAAGFAQLVSASAVAARSGRIDVRTVHVSGSVVVR